MSHFSSGEASPVAMQDGAKQDNSVNESPGVVKLLLEKKSQEATGSMGKIHESTREECVRCIV